MRKSTGLEPMNNDKNSQAKDLNKTLGLAINENLKFKEARYAESTIGPYRRKSKQLVTWFGKKKLIDFSSTDIEMMVVKLLKKYNGCTVNHYLEILRSVFVRAKLDGLIPSNPMENIKKCKFTRKKPKPFLQSEIALLLQQNKQENYQIETALIQVGIATGLRISELLALSAEVIDLEKKMLTIDLALVNGVYKTPKNEGSRRTIELTAQAIEPLTLLLEQAKNRKAKNIKVTQNDNRTKLIESRTLLAYFCAKRRPYASVDEYREKFFKPYCISLGVDYRGPSQFRHTFASQLLSAGINVPWIARQMGHAGTEMIQRCYGQWLVEDAVDFGAQAGAVLQRCLHSNAVDTVEQSAAPSATLYRNWNELMTMPEMQSIIPLIEMLLKKK